MHLNSALIITYVYIQLPMYYNLYSATHWATLIRGAPSAIDSKRMVQRGPQIEAMRESWEEGLIKARKLIMTVLVRGTKC